jgi:pimeloyl-ACP methyl ester carboxylesterase
VEVRTTDDSGHRLPEERPDLVAEAVEETFPG